ncbi:MAG: CpXC domain-containing protein [Clostridia bacterium]|nr:CpXC domain-containing protein [Clostridia bacterium]
MTELDIPCPRCGNKQSFCFHETINVREQPELKAQVMDGSIFDMTCAVCGKVSRIGYPLLYHDPDSCLMVFMVDPGNREMAIEAMHKLITVPEVQMAVEDYMIRAVSQPPHLAEKILLRDEKLDDRTVELMKLSLTAHVKERFGQEPDDIVLVKTDDLQFFVMRSPDGMPDLYRFYPKGYVDTAAKYQAFYPTDPEENLFIDDDWASAFLTPADMLQ